MKTVGYKEKETFPLNGMELRSVIRSFWIIPMAVNEPDEYEIWVKHNPVIAANISKLIKWSDGEKNGGIDKKEI